MSKDDRPQGETPRNPPVPQAASDQLPQGRYIPYSGGSMGWFENQGVLKSERHNGYRFYTVMESEHVRAALFQRWSMVTDKRRAQRIARENSVNVMMSDESVGETAYRIDTGDRVIEGTTRDISIYGMRMAFTEPVALNTGDAVKVTLLNAEDGQPLLEVPAIVIWSREEVVVRRVWFVGVAFQDITADTERFLTEFVGQR